MPALTQLKAGGVRREEGDKREVLRRPCTGGCLSTALFLVGADSLP